ncbi:hypothetical protein D3C87_1763630 [compost metagenome]
MGAGVDEEVGDRPLDRERAARDIGAVEAVDLDVVADHVQFGDDVFDQFVKVDDGSFLGADLLLYE